MEYISPSIVEVQMLGSQEEEQNARERRGADDEDLDFSPDLDLGSVLGSSRGPEVKKRRVIGKENMFPKLFVHRDKEHEVCARCGRRHDLRSATEEPEVIWGGGPAGPYRYYCILGFEESMFTHEFMFFFHILTSLLKQKVYSYYKNDFEMFHIIHMY
jgi:hypothetical protein